MIIDWHLWSVLTDGAAAAWRSRTPVLLVSSSDSLIFSELIVIFAPFREGCSITTLNALPFTDVSTASGQNTVLHICMKNVNPVDP